MKSRGVHLQYSFEHHGQRGAELNNPLFDLLAAVREHGSIQHAATGLGLSYRHVWGALKHWQEVMGEPLVTWTQGQPARLTPFADRLLWAETRARARLTPHIEALRAELERVLAEALDGSQHVLPIFASHDLALPLLRDLAARDQRLHVDLRFAGSVDALRALAEGRCLVAGFHVPPILGGAQVFGAALKPLLKPGRHKLIGFGRRAQGLMVAKDNPLRLVDLSDVVLGTAQAKMVRFAQRQEGSGTRLLTHHLLGSLNLPAQALDAHTVTTEDSHVAVAAAVASGVADAGMGLAAAAQAFGLDFVPLVEEDYFLVCLKDALDHPAVLKLRSVLASPAWREALSSLTGYEMPSAGATGQVLSLVRALPWWSFRQGKAERFTTLTTDLAADAG